MTPQEFDVIRAAIKSAYPTFNIIRQLSEIIRKQSYEIAHMRNLYGFTEENTSQIQGTDLAKAALERYNEIKESDL